MSPRGGFCGRSHGSNFAFACSVRRPPSWEVLERVGVDGVGVKFPFYPFFFVFVVVLHLPPFLCARADSGNLPKAWGN